MACLESGASLALHNCFALSFSRHSNDTDATDFLFLGEHEPVALGLAFRELPIFFAAFFFLISARRLSAIPPPNASAAARFATVLLIERRVDDVLDSRRVGVVCGVV